ncbi:MAG TPA: NHL domain-containing thioredoxin family protein [Mycobacteriales bacterium]|nr:NHL domain-containing thioredoxin family protein [Mycobacteriales bacterium]
MTTSRPARIRAPELVGGGGWIGADRSLRLRDLRGRFVLLDFWTSCCVNCLHVLDELRPLEQRFADVLVVLGVHSPKFAHEADHAALVDAVERYEVRHPVLDDPDLATWSQYAVRAWPTLVLIDPEGYIVHTASGEGHGEGLGRLLAQLVDEHDAKGTLRRGGPPYAPAPVATTALRFPGKVAALPDGTLLVSDTAHHSLVVLDADLRTELARIGTGERGLLDGTAPRFAEPQGVCVLADGTVLVADSANHVLRQVDLARGSVTTVAGTGAVRRPGEPVAGAGRDVALSTPWDLCAYDGRVVVAMAGTHQLWEYDPGARTVRVLAGTTGEGLRDGDAGRAYLAQPSGLAAGLDRLWFVDAETSALRWYRDGQVGTAVGTGLFDFGHRDGPAAQALLQHPLGVCVLPDGSVAVLDTYNGAVRRYDPATDEVSTLAAGVPEPSGAVVVGDELVVVASAGHRLQPVGLTAAGLVAGAAQSTRRPVTALAPGPVALDVVFTPPPGQRLDERDGPATRLVVTASPPELLVDGAGAGTGLQRSLVLAGSGEGVLHVAATAASCDTDSEHPACRISQQDWGIPVTLSGGAPAELRLVLRGAS